MPSRKIIHLGKTWTVRKQGSDAVVVVPARFTFQADDGTKVARDGSEDLLTTATDDELRDLLDLDE